MKGGFICVAGINQQTGKHVRPVLIGRLRSSLLATNGGPFDIASQVDLGQVTYNGRPPQVEDHLFDPQNATRLSDISADAFWNTLTHVARERLSDIFGSDLQQRGNGCTVDPSRGSGSLGCFRPMGRLTLYVNGFDKIRLSLGDGQFSVDLSVTDLRFYEDDYKTPRFDIVQNVANRIVQGIPVIIGVGLTQPWQKPGDTESRHWLQANNIHLRDDPVWRLG